MTKRRPRSTARPPRGRFTPPGFIDPGAPVRVPRCPGCAAEARGERYDPEFEWQRLQATIDRSGMAVQAVLADKPRDGWAYTIGRMRRGLPELVVLGLDPYVAQNLLNFIDENWDDVLNGDHDDSWQLIPIPDRIWETTTYLAGADRDAEERNLERLAMQVVWADDEEGFPWDPDFDRKVAKPQRILGLLP